MSEAVFSAAILTLGGKPDRGTYATLESAYDEGERAYHGLHHIQAALNVFFRLWDGEDRATGARAVLALLYHDVVYDPRAKDNEARSAALARSSLACLGLREEDLAEIERLILATRDHVASDTASALVADADLAILAAPASEYDRYAAAIRREYAFVPENDYRAGRTRVLEDLLGRERLFTLPLVDEGAARANLRREIEGLR